MKILFDGDTHKVLQCNCSRIFYFCAESEDNAAWMSDADDFVPQCPDCEKINEPYSPFKREVQPRQLTAEDVKLLSKKPAPLKVKHPVVIEEHCHAARDGECFHRNCPQLRDNEPAKSGRSCPLPDYDEEE